MLLLMAGAGPAQAATITTPYLAMTVQAGQTVTIDLTVADEVSQRLDLSVQGAPEGWEVSILGGGRPVSAIQTDPDNDRLLDLQVKIPADQEEGTHTLTVVARAGAATVSLPIALTVSEVEGRTTELTAEYDALRGPATATFTYSLLSKTALWKNGRITSPSKVRRIGPVAHAVRRHAGDAYRECEVAGLAGT